MEGELKKPVERNVLITKNQLDMAWEYAKNQNDNQCKTYLQLFILFFGLAITTTLTVLSYGISTWCILLAIVFVIISILYINRLRLLSEDLEEAYIHIKNNLDKLK